MIGDEETLSSFDRLTMWAGAVRWIPATVAAVPSALVRFGRHRCAQWSAALAYYSLVGLVPLLMAAFAVAKMAGVHHEITPYLLNVVSAGSAQVSDQIIHFIDQTDTGTIGLVGVLGAAFAAFGILANAEMCLNTIWGGVRGRPLVDKLGAFSGVLLSAPGAILLPLALTAALRSESVRIRFDAYRLGPFLLGALDLLPYVLLWGAFTVFYTRVPNTLVRRRSALAGALVAGTLWQLAQVTYMSFVIRAVGLSTVYGALWQLPILMAWIYIAWSIVLFGAEVSRAHHEVVAQRISRRLSAPPAPDTVHAE